MRLGERLITLGLVSEADVHRALAVQSQMGGRLGSILIRLGALSEDSLLTVLHEQTGLPIFSSDIALDIKSVNDFMSSLPLKQDWLVDNNIILWKIEKKIYALSKDYEDSIVRDALNYIFPGGGFYKFLIKNQDFENLLSLVKSESAVSELFDSSDRSIKALIEEAPVVEFVNNILSQAVDLLASDIHIEPSRDVFSVRFRIDGILHQIMTQPFKRYPAIGSRIKLISGLDISEKRLPQDGRITLRISGKDIDVRVSTAPGVFGESVVLRLLPKDRGKLSLSNLGFSPKNLALLQKLLKTPNGIMLVTGPTGSGKSTTLYAALEEMSNGSSKIITVEDPVEYQVSGITQIQAHAEIGYTFSKALRAILRQDPDTIMIGEIRDLDTAQIAIQSALTGHLVLSTLHTNDASSAFTRLIDMGIEPFLVAASVRGVQAQRLVRTLCSFCAEKYPEPILPEAWDNLKVSINECNWKQPVGCDKCNFTGYKGRIGIHEIVTMTHELQQLIAERAPLQDIQTYLKHEGHLGLLEDGLLKASQGTTSVEEVMRVAFIDQLV